MYCPNCGHNVLGDARFCANCGAPAPQGPSGSQGGRPAEVPPTSIPDTSAQDTRKCEWCAEVIPEAAVRCPKCQQWRKDIGQDRAQAYFWGVLGIIMFVFFLAGVREGRWGTLHLYSGSRFSVEAFLTSPGGLLILAGFCGSALLCWKYSTRVTRKGGVMSARAPALVEQLALPLGHTGIPSRCAFRSSGTSGWR